MTYKDLPGQLVRPEDHEQRMEVARDIAGWHLGDPSWAGEILYAYFNPERAKELLDMERDS